MFSGFSRYFDGTEWHEAPSRLIHVDHLEPKLSDLQNHAKETIPIDRMIVAYRRPPNLKNLLFPRNAESKCPSATPVSILLDIERPSETPVPPSNLGDE